VVKLIKICTGYEDLAGQFRDEWKIKRVVLLEHHPSMCDNLQRYRINDTCASMKRR